MNDFPTLKQNFYGKPLVYLDSSATTQKPQAVIDAITRYYTEQNVNVHRGVYALSERTSKLYENTREAMRAFINAQDVREIIFTRGTTEGINLLAYVFEQSQIKANDEIIISSLEHHSNIVPWQRVCQNKGARLKVIPLQKDGQLDLDAYSKLINSRTKLIAVTHVSNVLGVINPIKEMVRIAHQQQIPVLVDGAQAVSHLEVDVQDLDCDFYVFSGHKMYGPTGVGILYGKRRWLEKLPPYQMGGNMIRHVSFEKTEYQDLPYKFEAGTASVAEVMGLNAAIEYIQKKNIKNIMVHEQELLNYATEQLNRIPGIKILGPQQPKIGIISFVWKDVHAHDIATILDRDAIAVRAGHHCAMPLINLLGVSATTRISFGIYNQKSDIDRLVESLQKIKAIFGDAHV